jgi:agarase
LRDWHFNTVGAWSAREMIGTGIAYAPVLDMAASAGRDVWLKGGVVDYFSPAFRAAADRAAAAKCAPHAKDPWLLGYFTDNELRWGKDWRSGETLLDSYLKMPPDSPGFHAAAELIRRSGHTVQNLTPEDQAEFLGLVAAEYARVTHDAIRKYDPNPGDSAIRAVAPYFDVISYHSYDADAPVKRLEQVNALTGKPVMITEFSFKAMDSGLPNTKGAAKPVATQADRADGFTHYVTALAQLPYAVGFHWFEYRDEPKEGRFDGENSNYGVVKIDSTPWTVLTDRMSLVNQGIEALHWAASKPKR